MDTRSSHCLSAFSLAALLIPRLNLKSRILSALSVLSDTPCTLSDLQTDLFLLPSQFTLPGGTHRQLLLMMMIECCLVFCLFVSFEILLYFHSMVMAETYQHVKLQHPLLQLGLT